MNPFQSKLLAEIIGVGGIFEIHDILRSYFEDIKHELIGKEIQIDFRQIAIMSSSLFVELIKFLNILEKNKTNVELIYNGKLDWQNASFKSLAKLIKNHNYITIKSEE